MSSRTDPESTPESSRGTAHNYALFFKQAAQSPRSIGMSLRETIALLIPSSSRKIRVALSLQMAGRWRHALESHPDDRGTANVRSSDDRRVAVLSTLPYDRAMGYVRAWLPWAIASLRDEVMDLVNSLNITPEMIAVGAEALESDGHEDDDVLL